VPKLAEHTRTERRGQILAAALTCFARDGYHTTTMADIATEAGVSKGTPYLYFPSKEALYVTLYQEWDCGLSARIETTIGGLTDADRSSPRRVLRAVAAGVGAHVVEEAETCRILMESRTLASYRPAIAAAVNAAEAATRKQLEELIQDGIAAGEWPPDTDPVLRARLVNATLHGLMAQWHQAPGSFSWDNAAALVAGEGA
jgi:AcrR family transcriptional regulator